MNFGRIENSDSPKFEEGLTSYSFRSVSILQAVVSCSFACKIKKLIFTSRYVLLVELGFLLLARKEHIVKNHCPGLEPRTGA